MRTELSARSRECGILQPRRPRPPRIYIFGSACARDPGSALRPGPGHACGGGRRGASREPAAPPQPSSPGAGGGEKVAGAPPAPPPFSPRRLASSPRRRRRVRELPRRRAKFPASGRRARGAAAGRAGRHGPWRPPLPTRRPRGVTRTLKSRSRPTCAGVSAAAPGSPAVGSERGEVGSAATGTFRRVRRGDRALPPLRSPRAQPTSGTCFSGERRALHARCAWTESPARPGAPELPESVPRAGPALRFPGGSRPRAAALRARRSPRSRRQRLLGC